MDKRFLGVLAAIVIIFGGVFLVSNHSKSSTTSTTKGASGLTSHVEGKGTTGVRLIEYGDFQCPACGQFHPIVKQVQAKYADQIFFQFRNFPLYQIHPNAIAGARAAEAADLQGKYWQMHDALYTNQNDWVQSNDPNSLFTQYARQIGLDVTQFQIDFKSSLVNNRIQADLAEGKKLGVDSTPTFFIDGKKISNPQSLDAFNKVIDTAITQKTGEAPQSSNATPATNTAGTPGE